MKNVLITIHHLCRGGAERSAAKLSSFLVEDHNVYIATFIDEKFYPTSYPPKGQLLSLKQAPSKGLLNWVKSFRSRVKFIREIKRKYNIDVSISFLQSADIVNVITQKDEETIVNIRTSKAFLLRGKLAQLIYSLVFKKASQIIFQNQANEKIFKAEIDSIKGKTKVIPNFYHIEGIIEKSKEDEIKLIRNDEKILLNVGRLYKVKGQLFLFRILKALINQGQNVKLVLIGEGDQRENYIQFCEKIGLKVIMPKPGQDHLDMSEGDVFLMGFSSNPFSYIKYCDLFVFSSLYEGFPNALAEAMICGACVLSTNCEVGPKELILGEVNQDHLDYPVQSDRGILLPIFSDEDPNYNDPITPAEKVWIETVTATLNDSKKQETLGRNAAEWMQRYDEKIIKNQWKNLLNA